MAREQFGICAEANLHGFVFLINVLDGHHALLRVQLARLHALIQRLSDQFSESNLSAVIAVGAGYWDSLYPSARPQELQSFPPLVVDDLDMPASPFDLLLQIRSDRYDVLHLAAQQCFQLLQPHVEVQEQIHAFRYMDGRDLTGFIDQPGAPKGKRKRELALVSEDNDPLFAGGSYLHFQRYRLDLNRWQQLTQNQQELIMGYKKMDGSFIASAQLSGQSHAVTAALTSEESRVLPLLFQNMPYGQLKVQGMLTLGFSADGRAYLQWLKNRMGQSGQQNYDLLLDYVQADCGAAFFAPSISFMEQEAGL
ncbi:Dyp-type peroxidase [Rheinheimera sp.]|uniref:Dyp-type peroxidase n=1 Tax=Rheinheimera sp. TaxID=1869214 RepID=UPI0027B9775F|nr:Dyp-type peroxidase [Rheinheimera sp.]